MLRKLGVLTMLACLTYVASEPVGTCPAVNTRPSTFLPHATDCTLYYICNHGSPILMPACHVGERFDIVTSRCSSSPDAVCHGDPVPETTIPAGTTLPPPVTDEPTTIPGEVTTVEVPTEPTEPETTVPEDTTVVADTTVPVEATTVGIPTAPIVIPTAEPIF